MRRRERERELFLCFFFEHADGGRGRTIFFSLFFCSLPSFFVGVSLRWRRKTKREIFTLFYAHKEIEYNGGTFYAFRLFIPAIDLI